MRKILILTSAAVIMTAGAHAQSAIDAYRLSQPDLKGTARYMSMAGAFGALGGDLSVLSHNPGGIGVYRNSDVGLTLDLDMQHSESNSQGWHNGINQTKFLLNNAGFVWTLKLPSASCPNLNFGFTYNKSASFNRRYRGSINLSNSLSNYIGAVTTQGQYVEGQLIGDEYNKYDPYNPSDPSDAAPWLSVLGYNGYLFSQDGLTHEGTPYYLGQWNGSGTGYFDVQESGGVDSYNIALGGNIANVVYWGMDFDITHLNYNLTPMWSEDLPEAYVGDDSGTIYKMPSRWTLNNYYNCSGTGFNYKLGFIVKPIQEFRIGFAFETPTWYGLTETFSADIDALYNKTDRVQVQTNDGWPGVNDVNFRTPWKINVGAAGVLLNRLIISAEYEWTQYKGMKYSTPTNWWGGGDYWYDDYYPWDDWYYAGTRASGYDPYVGNPDNFYYTNQNIQNTYCNTNTFRLGAELRVLPQLSVRAGYSYVSSPVNSKVKDSMVETAGTIPNYRFDNTTNYVTCGLGFRVKSFYVDLAYVYKHMTSEYHAFSPFYPDPNKDYDLGAIPSQKSSLSLDNSQVVLSAGFKF